MNSANVVRFTIKGEPGSKANSREIVTRRFRDKKDGTIRKRPISIKSEKARDYERAALLQIPAWARVEFTGPVRVTLRIWYASERPDLDESVILDVMQSRYETVIVRGVETQECVRRGVYRNDRQVKQKFVFWALDRDNPRADIRVRALTAQQCDLFAFPGAQACENALQTDAGVDQGVSTSQPPAGSCTSDFRPRRAATRLTGEQR